MENNAEVCTYKIWKFIHEVLGGINELYFMGLQ